MHEKPSVIPIPIHKYFFLLFSVTCDPKNGVLLCSNHLIQQASHVNIHHTTSKYEML